MNASIDIIDLFQIVLVPVLMISGIGLFILVIQTRYGRVVDSIRAINNERLELIKKTVIKKVSKVELQWNNYRLEDLQKQVTILIRRGKLLKDSLQLMFISIFTFILSSLALFIDSITKISLSLIVLIIFSLGMAVIFISCINIIIEVTSSFKAVIYDIDSHVPEKYRFKTKYGIFGDLEKEEM